MKVLIISSYIFGYMDFAVKEMKRQGHEVNILYYDKPPFVYAYKNTAHKVFSGVKKIFGSNEKKNFRYDYLNKNLSNEKFDKTLIIHGQYLEERAHIFLKSISREYIAFFFDSLKKMPRQRNVINYFDKIYSYEPVDCEYNNFLFLTNFIPVEAYRSKEFKYYVFNISSLDHRLETLKNVAKYLKEKNISFHFRLVNNRLKSLENFTICPKRIDVKSIYPLFKDAKILVDINRDDQRGLSFRPFEALGNEKKLITNNPEIRNYDFYNPQNIFVFDENNIQIPDEFFQTEYISVPVEIYEKYSLRTWVKKVLND